MRKSKGFTLIELLVVIAIIGILAAIVLVSLSGARNKAKDARIKSSLGQIRAQAEIYNSDNNGYGAANALCADTNVTTLTTDMTSQGGVFACFSTAAAYCVSSTLNAGGNSCVSSNGKMGTIACVAAGTACQ